MYLLDLHKNASHHTYQAPNSELVFVETDSGENSCTYNKNMMLHKYP